MTIPAKLYSLLGFLILCFGMLLFILARQAAFIQDNYIGLTEQTLPTQNALMEIKANVLRIVSSANELGIIITNTGLTDNQQVQRDAEVGFIATGKTNFLNSYTNYSTLVDQYFPDEAEFKSDIGHLGEQLILASDQLIARFYEQQSPTEIISAKENLEALEVSLLKVIDSAIVYENKELEEKAAEVGKNFDSTKTLIIVSMVSVTGISLIIVFAGVRRITQPLIALRDAAKAIGDGCYSMPAIAVANDEIGELMEAFKKMSQKLEQSTRSRERTEQELRISNDNLEQRVEARTRELKAVLQKNLREERLVTMGKMAATVSHEIRNPLGAIQSALFVIDELAAKDNPMLADSIEVAETGINQCNNIITDLLDFSRVRSLKLENVSIDSWLEALLETYPMPPEIVLNCDFKARRRIAIDSDRFRRAVQNLLDNACQAILGCMDKQDAKRSYQIMVGTQVNNERLVISIKDNGPGIKSDDLEHVFEPLFTTKNFGVGLGLPLVKQTMEQHSGGVKVATEVNQGTEFSLWLPILMPE